MTRPIYAALVWATAQFALASPVASIQCTTNGVVCRAEVKVAGCQVRSIPDVEVIGPDTGIVVFWKLAGAPRWLGIDFDPPPGSEIPSYGVSTRFPDLFWAISRHQANAGTAEYQLTLRFQTDNKADCKVPDGKITNRT